jgi:hypothetical protein
VAVPFGGHPTLERFVEWAVSLGCKASIKVRRHSQTGRPYEVLEIVGPGGGSVAVTQPDPTEFLAPSQVAYLQRRIGLRSPFPATPEPPDPAALEFVSDGTVDLKTALRQSVGEIEKRPAAPSVRRRDASRKARRGE